MGTQPQFASGYVVGTGAAISIPCGFIPDIVFVSNLSDGDRLSVAQLAQVVPFSSGGTAAITAGMTLVGATSGATFKIKQVIISSGSFAAGNAAGWFVVDDVTGTIGSENAYVQANGTSIDDATVTVNVTHEQTITTATANVASNKIVPFPGVPAGAAPGFTIGSADSTSGKLLNWFALLN